nr:hypothetical protein [Desulfurococcales archaeon]
ELIEHMQAEPLPRRQEPKLMKLYRDQGHHVRECSHLDPKVENIVMENKYIWGFTAGSILLDMSPKECKVSLGKSDDRGYYIIRVELECKGRKTIGLFHTTAITQGQAEHVRLQIRQKLKEKGLC